MLDFFSNLFYLPWEGAKIVTRIVIASSIMLSTQPYFNKPLIKPDNKQVIIYTELKNSFNKDIEKLLKSTTPIMINFSVILQTKAGILSQKKFYKEFKYDLFENKYYYFNSLEQSEYLVTEMEKLKLFFEYLILPVCSIDLLEKHKKVEVIIQAEIIIKEKIEELKNYKLWEGTKPRLNFIMENIKKE